MKTILIALILCAPMYGQSVNCSLKPQVDVITKSIFDKVFAELKEEQKCSYQQEMSRPCTKSVQQSRADFYKNNSVLLSNFEILIGKSGKNDWKISKKSTELTASDSTAIVSRKAFELEKSYADCR